MQTIDSIIATKQASVVSTVVTKIKATYEIGKPKVLSLLLVTTACPMILASSGMVSYWSVLYAIIGGALVSSSASIINCIWDLDIDRIMKRTKNRPLVKGDLSTTFAAVYSLILGFSGIIWLALMLNPYSAFLALSGHLFYVFIYTMWLKRTTPQNIVIGGAAGAIPPLVGWAAVTGKLELQAILMFLLVFLWTPPHFWALALNKNEDYKAAGVPMMPVVHGERHTHIQMLYYSISLLPVSILLVLTDSNLGFFSMIVFLSMGIFFCLQNYSLVQLGRKLPSPELDEKKTKLAWQIFGFSIFYLFAVFFTLVIDTLVL